jgi:hypothetical protein
VADTGNNLFTFLAARLSASFTNLNCGQFGLQNTVNVTQDGNGVATAATFNLTRQVPGQQPTATASASASASTSATPSASQSAPSTVHPWTPWTPGGNGY